MINKIQNFFNTQHGATAIEYALIGSLISIVVVVAGALIGNSVEGMFNLVLSKM